MKKLALIKDLEEQGLEILLNELNCQINIFNFSLPELIENNWHNYDAILIANQNLVANLLFITQLQNKINSKQIKIIFLLYNPMALYQSINVIDLRLKPGQIIRRINMLLGQNCPLLFNCIQQLRLVEFQFKTLSEAQNLAELLSSWCPSRSMVRMGLLEIFINAIEHGNLGLSSKDKAQVKNPNLWIESLQLKLLQPKYLHKKVRVFFRRYQHRLKFTIIDEGLGFDYRTHFKHNLEPGLNLHGRGLLLAKQLAFDQIYFSGPGNSVHCEVNIPLASASHIG